VILGQHPFAAGDWQFPPRLFALDPYLGEEVLPGVTAEQQRRLSARFDEMTGWDMAIAPLLFSVFMPSTSPLAPRDLTV